MEILWHTTGIVGTLLLLYSVFIYVVARICHDNSVMDVAYGPAFFVTTAGAAYLTGTADPLPLIVIGCIGLWATRLFVRIFRKNYGRPEDARYAAWRSAWMQRGRAYFLVRSYLQINLLQCVIILIVVLPAIVALSFPTALNPWFVAAGLAVFLFGLSYETIADWQLDQFIARKKAGVEPANLMTTGLFHYSRRPNYFGECLVWAGLATMVLPAPLGPLAIASPLLITYITSRITGPMLEDMFLEKFPDEYREYIRTTNYFVPGRPRV